MRDPVECESKKCPHCHEVVLDDRWHVARVLSRIRRLSPEDLRWWFREAEAQLGARSTFGAFVDLAMSGIQSGGRSNGVERAWNDRKRAAAARERCIRRRIQLLQVPSPVLAVLAAAYGPRPEAIAMRAERVTGLVAARQDLLALFGELLPVVLLTSAAAPFFEPVAPAPSPPTEVRGQVRCGGTVREEHRKDFAAGEGSVVSERPQAEMVFDSVLRVDGPVETIDAVETPASFLARIQSGDASATRGEVHVRRWRGDGDGQGGLARLAEVAHQALRARVRAASQDSKPYTREESAAAEQLRAAERMLAEANRLLASAQIAVGLAGEIAPAPPPKKKRRSAQRPRRFTRAA